MISAQFIFKPGTFDDEFHKLDAEIEAFVATIPGFLGAEKWISFDGLVPANAKLELSDPRIN